MCSSNPVINASCSHYLGHGENPFRIHSLVTVSDSSLSGLMCSGGLQVRCRNGRRQAQYRGLPNTCAPSHCREPRHLYSCLTLSHEKNELPVGKEGPEGTGGIPTISMIYKGDKSSGILGEPQRLPLQHRHDHPDKARSPTFRLVTTIL